MKVHARLVMANKEMIQLKKELYYIRTINEEQAEAAINAFLEGICYGTNKAFLLGVKTGKKKR